MHEFGAFGAGDAVILGVVAFVLSCLFSILEVLGVWAGHSRTFRFGPTLASASTHVDRRVATTPRSVSAQSGRLTFWRDGEDRLLFARSSLHFGWTPLELKGTIDWTGSANGATVTMRLLLGPIIASGVALVVVPSLVLLKIHGGHGGTMSTIIQELLLAAVIVVGGVLSFQHIRRRARRDIEHVISVLRLEESSLQGQSRPIR